MEAQAIRPRRVMKEYRGFKYKIRIRLDGRCLFAVWWADANSRREDPIWLKTVASREAAERVVKGWIDGRQPKLSARGRTQAPRQLVAVTQSQTLRQLTWPSQGR
jgi:hypothetical protein